MKKSKDRRLMPLGDKLSAEDCSLFMTGRSQMTYFMLFYFTQPTYFCVIKIRHRHNALLVKVTSKVCSNMNKTEPLACLPQ